MLFPSSKKGKKRPGKFNQFVLGKVLNQFIKQYICEYLDRNIDLEQTNDLK